MHKVASDRQIELCKLAAIRRYAEQGIPEELGKQLFDSTLNKLGSIRALAKSAIVRKQS